MSDLIKEMALVFIKEYAQQNQFFTGGDILKAMRVARPELDQDWRNKWGVVISQGARNGWYVKAGRVTPTTKQSHTESLVQWQSRLFKGEQSLVGTTAKAELEKIRKGLVLREYDAITALWKAYELGVAQKNCN
jgi:hypothetical protein